MVIHHIAYAVADIETAANGFSLLGFSREGDPVDDCARNVRILFMSDIAGARIELVEPLNADAPVCSQLEKSHGVSVPYHICVEVESIPSALTGFLSKGVMPVSSVAPAPAIGNRDVCFVFSESAGLIELLEASRNE